MKMKETLFIVLFSVVLTSWSWSDALSFHMPAMRAIENGRWYEAKGILTQQERAYEEERQAHLNARPDPFTGMIMDFYAGINHVQSCVELAIVSCNCKEYEDAASAMRKAVMIIRSEPSLRGNNGAERAERFLEKICQRGFDMTFSSTEQARLCMFIIEVPSANFSKSMRASINLSNAISSYCDSRMKTYQYESDRIARQAKREADYEYFKATGSDYDPKDPPIGRKERIEWDYCTKIHAIFK